jgi:hypothetical protein
MSNPSGQSPTPPGQTPSCPFKHQIATLRATGGPRRLTLSSDGDIVAPEEPAGRRTAAFYFLASEPGVQQS